MSNSILSYYDYILDSSSLEWLDDYIGNTVMGIDHVRPPYIEEGLSEEEALTQEIICYNKSNVKNAEILFCAFQCVHNIYLKARRVDPNDNQSQISKE